MKKTVIISAMLGLGLSAAATVTLPDFITDNMIFQQNSEATLTGHAAPGSKVTVTPGWSGETVTTKAGADGSFSVKIATPEAGGPWNITFADKDGEKDIVNVLSGEVWLCSGQSNMEFPVKGWTTVMDVDNVVETAQHPDIRLLQVRKNIQYSPQENTPVNMGGWVCASPATMDFSAIAYLFALRLHEELGVPVGVIDTSWGGTPAESWTSYEYLKGVKGFEDELAALERANFDGKKLKADYDRNLNEWVRMAHSDVPDFDKTVMQTGKEWVKMPAGKNLESTILPYSFDGVVWAQYSFEAPKGSAGKAFTLHFCPIDDEDVTYVNGKEVARGAGWNIPRTYQVPAGVLRDGQNIITMRISDFGGNGGFNGNPEDMYAEIDGTKVMLTDDWNASVALDFATLPKKPVSVDGAGYPSVLYNGMLYPLRNLPVKGTLWYQGCANVGRADQYEPLFQALIKNWRELFGENMPFYFVQLAGWLEPRNVQPDSEWAALRNSQAKALALPNTGMAVAIDLGNPADIHPRNKQAVADRLARIALKHDYGKETVWRAPALKSSKAVGDRMVLTFDGPVQPTSKCLLGFIVGDADGNFQAASARQTAPGVIEVWSPKIKKPAVARYDWADYPQGNLYGADGLPVAPFATDK